MLRQTYDELLKNLDEALKIARALGLQLEVEASRFREYRERLDYLIRIVRAQRAGVITEPIDRTLRGEQDRYVIALSESSELGSLAGFLAACEADVLRTRLRRILAGPAMPVEEDQNSNEAGNVLFELNLAEKLARGWPEA
ncbi:MAG: hypothetical protein HY002_08065 [Candidatus Rokubacteria bacterium]|nr:hypothetical protein [Candidatus Rokubacteria bacterium]